MPETPAPTGIAHTTVPDVATSKVVTTAFDAILAAINHGELQPGQRISDTELAAQFGVSRTPVREALQRLRELGLIEASASRFTRVAVTTPEQTAQAMRVWLALYVALIEETVPLVHAGTVKAMRHEHETFQHAVAQADMEALATANLNFFGHLVAVSANEYLRKAITSVMHIIRLGALHLPDQIDFAELTTVQETLLDALAAHDTAAALGTVELLRRIRIPQGSKQD